MKISGTRIASARLKSDMSRADLAYAIRRISGGEIRATERGVRGWEKGEYAPRSEVVPAIAKATGCAIEFFYAESEGDVADAPDGPFRDAA